MNRTILRTPKVAVLKHLCRVIIDADSSYSFIIAALYFILWLYYIVCIWYPFDRHLDWFWFSIILTSLYICKDFYGIWRVAACKRFFRFRDSIYLPIKIFMTICTPGNYIWKYLFPSLECWLFQGLALCSLSPLFLAMCPLKSQQWLLIAVHGVPFPSLHLTPAVPFLLLLLQPHWFFLLVSQTHLLLVPQEVANTHYLDQTSQLSMAPSGVSYITLGNISCCLLPLNCLTDFPQLN